MRGDPAKRPRSRRAKRAESHRLADPSADTTSDGPAARALAPLPCWGDIWERFLERHSPWWRRVGAGHPVYTLPPEVIKALAEAGQSDAEHRPSLPTIDEADAEAEREFLAACMSFSCNTVGVWGGYPVDYPLLAEQEVRLAISDREMDELGWTQEVSLGRLRSSLQAVSTRLNNDRHQLLGYVGRLTFDPQFRGEKSALQDRWASLKEPPPLPLLAGVADQRAMPVGSMRRYRSDVIDGARKRFLIDFSNFMRKWRLSRLLSWDLPEPQGPLEQVPLGLASSFLGPNHPTDVIPSYYDTPSAIDLRETIRERQRATASDDGILMQHPATNTSSRDGRASQFEAAFRIWLIEESVVRRYGKPRGVVGRLTRGFSDLLGVSEDRVRQLRKLHRSVMEPNS